MFICVFCFTLLSEKKHGLNDFIVNILVKINLQLIHFVYILCIFVNTVICK